MSACVLSPLQSQLFPISSPRPGVNPHNECMHERNESPHTLIHESQRFQKKANRPLHDFESEQKMSDFIFNTKTEKANITHCSCVQRPVAKFLAFSSQIVLMFNHEPMVSL